MNEAVVAPHAGYTLCNYGHPLLASPLAAKGVFAISAEGIELLRAGGSELTDGQLLFKAALFILRNS